MHKPNSSWLTIAALSALMPAQVACSRSSAGAADGSKVSSDHPLGVATALGNACDRKLVTREDVAGLLSEPIKSAEPLAGDAQSCVFASTNDSTVTVSLRPGLGDETLREIASGETNQTTTPLAGVGQKAVWNAVLKEVNASKGNILCDVGVVGPASQPATAEKVGAVCNKLFAAK